MRIYYVYCVKGSKWYEECVERARAFHEPINVTTIDLADNYCNVWTAATSLRNLCGFFNERFENSHMLKKIVDDKYMSDDEKIDKLNELMCEWVYITWAEEGEEI